MLIPVPESVSDEVAVLGDPFAVSLHSVTRHPPPPGGKVLVYGGGALGSCATAILARPLPRRRGHGRGALARPGGTGARGSGATVVDPFPVEQLLEEAAAWSGGVLQKFGGDALPMAHPGGFDVVYDTVGTAETAEIGVRLLKQRGTMVKSGVHAPERWEWSPLYFKEISWVGSNAFGVEEVDGVRLHGIAHYLQPGRGGPHRHDGHAHPHLPARAVARGVHRAGHPGAERRHQGGLRLPLRTVAAGGADGAGSGHPERPVRRGGLHCPAGGTE